MISERPAQPGLQPVTDSDRRRYFRINDSVGIKLRVLDTDEQLRVAEQILAEHQPADSMAGSFFAMSQQLEHLLRNFKKREPDIAQYVSMLNEKLDLMARAQFMKDHELAQQPRQEVNISASGICYSTRKAVELGSVLELKLLVYPSLAYVHAICEVARCEPAEDPQTDGEYELGLDFRVIREDDREMLIQHVVQLESSQLRNRRATQ